MGFFTRTALTLTLAAAATATCGMSAKVHSSFNLGNYAYKARLSENQPFKNSRWEQITRTNDLFEQKKGTKRDAYVKQPMIQTVGPSEILEDIDTPWGEVWFYSGSYKNTYIKISEDYNRPIMQEFEFKIYDSKMNLKGTVRDKIRYKVYEDMVRPSDTDQQKQEIELYGPYHCEVAVAMCQVSPIITRSFFNNDEKLEVMVGMSVQTTYYHNNNYLKVYQLEGETYTEKDYEGKEQTYNKCLKTMEGMLGDVSTTVDASNNEKTYMTFMEDYEPDTEFEWPDEFGDIDDGEDEDEGNGTDINDIVIPGYWDNYCAYGIDAVVYRAPRAGESDIQQVKKFHLKLSKLPGDMQNSPFMISFLKDGKTHFMMSQYKDTFYNPYHNPLADMSMRQDNKLVVEIWKESADGKSLELDQSTQIPMYLSGDIGGKKVLGSYFSVGDFRYRSDINYKNSADGKAGFYVTKSDYLAGSDDSYVRSYYYYNADGTLNKTLFENCQSHITMGDLKGFEPQEIFINTNAMGDYIFHFVDLESVKEVLTLNYQFEIDPDIDPERMTSNMNRVLDGETYKYAAELRVPTQDDEGNDISRVLWFDRNGKFRKIDQINLGKGVFYAMIYMGDEALDPNFFYKDDNNEYMLLLKRAMTGASDNTVRVEELYIAQAVSEEYPKGRVFLSDGPDERGSISSIIPYYNENGSTLMVTKYSREKALYSWDVYALPFASSAVNDVKAPVLGENGISYNGRDVMCAGADIAIYAVNGILMARGADTVSTEGLVPGIYVVRAGDKTVKIAVK